MAPPTAFPAATRLFSLLLILVASVLGDTAAAASNATSYEYIVIGSGPGGGALAGNLARHGHSVLLLEAGDNQLSNLNEEIPAWSARSQDDPAMRWDFYVNHTTNVDDTMKYNLLTWRMTNGSFYVGREPPPGSELLGVYYPRSGTLGGCSSHNALITLLPPDSDWEYIANVTGDSTWSASNMLPYFQRIEKCNYLPEGTPGHGFSGYLGTSQANLTMLMNQPQQLAVLTQAATALGKDPLELLEYISGTEGDCNSPFSPRRDHDEDMWGFTWHYDAQGRRTSSATYLAQVANATNPDGSKMYPLTIQFNSLATKVLFAPSKEGEKPQATGVAYLRGQSMYSADPRYDASNLGVPEVAIATREVIVSGGAFNSPQILKLSGIGPRDELSQFGIPVVADLPGVGANLHDNYETSTIALAAQNFTTLGIPKCTFGATDDPCLELWRQGTGPYLGGAFDVIKLKTSVAENNETDIFLWGSTSIFKGFWPGRSTTTFPSNSYNFVIVLMQPRNQIGGTVSLRSADPRDTPIINLNFFAEGGDQDLQALAEAVQFGRKVFDSVEAPVGPFTETEPCAPGSACTLAEQKEFIRTQSWSHHCTGTVKIGADDDPMAVLDSKFRVRGVTGLRVVDASVFPIEPGAFPVLPTFMISEKAADVILGDL